MLALWPLPPHFALSFLRARCTALRMKEASCDDMPSNTVTWAELHDLPNFTTNENTVAANLRDSLSWEAWRTRKLGDAN